MNAALVFVLNLQFVCNEWTKLPPLLGVFNLINQEKIKAFDFWLIVSKLTAATKKSWINAALVFIESAVLVCFEPALILQTEFIQFSELILGWKQAFAKIKQTADSLDLVLFFRIKAELPNLLLWLLVQLPYGCFQSNDFNAVWN